PRGGQEVFDWLDSAIEIGTPRGEILARERFRVPGSLLAAGTPGITGPYRAQGTVLVLDRSQPSEALVDGLRAALASLEEVATGVSALPSACGAWVRLLAPDGAALRRGMLEAWSAGRERLVGQRPVPRRK